MLYVRDSRTLLGGLGFILSGSIITSMLRLYFAGEYSGEGIASSRWWWEIVMNLQVLAVAFIWFCYTDRISDNVGAKKGVMRFRMYACFFIVLLPFWVALYSAQQNWFVERPPESVVDDLIFTMIIVWGLAVYVPRFVILIVRPKVYAHVPPLRLFIPRNWWTLTPSYMIALLWVTETLRGGDLHCQYIPFLLYIQGSVPYLLKGLGWRSATP